MKKPNSSTTSRTLDPKAPGRVILVGAGPGDPDLLTFKAAKAIASATLLLVDDLVNPAIVQAHAGPRTRVVHVGKRGGCKSTPQAFIEKMMVTGAQAGETVVRLKGGDPFIFGRGGEEVEALTRAGVQVDVVNGITAGLAAVTSLGVPLTHRDHAHGVIFVTGHARKTAGGTAQPSTLQPATDWQALAAVAKAQKLSLVIYMGITDALHIQQQLLAGMDARTPAAVIQNASLPQERHLVTTLANLVADMARQDFASPAILVVGEVLSTAQLQLQVQLQVQLQSQLQGAFKAGHQGLV